MKIKEGARISGLHISMRPAILQGEAIWKAAGEELVITCGLDGLHSAGSLHYYGRALDFRTRYFSSRVTTEVYEALKLALGSDYDVIKHSSHIHVEYDPK